MTPPADPRSKTFKRSAFGYCSSDVDLYLQRLSDSIAIAQNYNTGGGQTGLPFPSDLRSEAIAEKTFAVKPVGYRKREVRAYLQHLSSGLGA